MKRTSKHITLLIAMTSLLGLFLGYVLFDKQLIRSLRGPTERPNFLFIVTDDQSWIHTSFAGYPAVQTPNFDRIAREGVYFENAFSSAPSCTASRSAVLAGRHFWELGSASQLWGEFPTTLPTYQQILKKHGYKVGYSGKGWGPGYAPQGNPAGAGHDYNQARRDVDSTLTNIDQVENLRLFLGEKLAEQPFSYWVSPTEPHRPFRTGIGKNSGTVDLSLVEVPAFMPNSETIRSDMADYLYEIQWFDEELGRILGLLQEQGLLDNTVIVYTSDNGMPFPRAKSTLYDYGTRVPLAIRWGDEVRAPREVTDMISLIDFAPTFLELAGIEIPAEMSGKSLVKQLLSKDSGQIDPHRTQVFTGFERHIATARLERRGYPARAIRSSDYLYIRNFTPDRWPAGRPPTFDDIDEGSPTKTYLINQRKKYEQQTLKNQKKEGGMVITQAPNSNIYSISRDPAQSLTLIGSKRPAEELYVIRRDPLQLNNLAGDPAYVHIKEKLAKQLENEMLRTQDPWALGNGSVFDSYKYYGIDKPDSVAATEKD